VRKTPSTEHAAAIRDAIRKKYRQVSVLPAGQFLYPTGRPSALGLGYRPKWLADIPPGIVDRFVGSVAAVAWTPSSPQAWSGRMDT